MALRPPQEEGGEPLTSVRVEFKHLPPESRLKLDEALQAWAAWHADRYPEGYVPPEVTSGSLGYTPGAMLLGGDADEGAFVWEDKPEAPAKGGANTLWFNISYERVGDVPCYDRGSDAPLHHAVRKRQAPDGLPAAEGAARSAGRPAKRSRSAGRCFNCGSYGHSLRECFKEHDREQVEESRRELAELRGQRGAARRYYEPDAPPSGRRGGRGLEQEPGEFAGLEPGKLTGELRAALGIGPLAPPPWLQRMRELGLPPGYLAPAAADAADAGSAPSELRNADAGSPAAATPAAAATANGTAAAAEGAGGFGDLEDFIPLSGSPPPPLAAGSAPAEAACVAGGAVPAGGATDGATEGRLECAVQFPGVNAPEPEGADPQAWAPQRPASLSATPPSSQRAQQQQQQQPLPGSGGHLARRSSSGGWAGVAPLCGLHPPRQQAGPDGAPAAAQHPRQLPAMQHAASAPDLRWAQPPGMLPPGFGHPAQHAYPPQHAQQQYGQHAQQQHAARQIQQPAYPALHGGAPPAPEVFATSRSDPGHLLVYSQGPPAAGQLPGQQAAPHAQQQALHQHQGHAWGGAMPAPQPWQQQYGQQSFGLQQPHPGYSPPSAGQQQQQQHRWEQAGHGQPPQWEQPDSEQRRREQQEAQRRQHEYQQRLWQSSGR